MEILDPTVPPAGAGIAVPAAPSLKGAVVAVLTNRWRSMDFIAERLAAHLPAECGAADVVVQAIPLASSAPPATLDAVAARARIAVVGLAN